MKPPRIFGDQDELDHYDLGKLAKELRCKSRGRALRERQLFLTNTM